MKAYIITTAIIFGLIVITHITRLVIDGTQILHEPIFVIATMAALGMCGWGLSLIVKKKI